MTKIKRRDNMFSVLSALFDELDPEHKGPTITYDEKEYKLLKEGDEFDVFYNKETNTVLKLPQYTTVEEQKNKNKDSEGFWNEFKRDDVKKAEIVTANYNGKLEGREWKNGSCEVSVLKVPYFNYKRALEVAWNGDEYRPRICPSKHYENVWEAINKESMRVYLSTGKIIPGNMSNFVYDKDTDTAHCIDYRHAQSPPDVDLVRDETFIGRILNHITNDNVIRRYSAGVTSIKMIESINRIFGSMEKKGNFYSNLNKAIDSEYPNRLFAVQSKIRDYVDLRLGPKITLIDVINMQRSQKFLWKGHFKAQEKIESLGKLLRALNVCDDDDTEKLKTLLENIKTAQKTNLDLEKSGMLGLAHQGSKTLLGRHPGGELGKLLDQCEKDVKQIIQALENKNKPTPTT